jgi:hypothetical protein
MGVKPGLWSLTLNEECKLRLFENKVLRRIFGADEMCTKF